MDRFTLNELLKPKAKALTLESEVLKGLKHAPLKGSFREMILSNLIGPFLPATCGIFHGTVISSFTEDIRKKSEDDLLIVDKECLPPILYSERDGIFPIESVIARIEVKSTLDGKNLRDALKGCREFKKLRMNLKSYQYKHKADRPPNDTFQAIFAFESKIKNEYKILTKVLSGMGAGEEPPLDCLCVVGKAMLSWGNKRDTEDKRWLVCCREKEEPDEILAFLALLLDKLPSLRQQRKEAIFGKYILCMKSDKMKNAEEVYSKCIKAQSKSSTE